ncbi:TIGR03089 family protein [Streptomyces sp. A7024]|uniref:TIGR03089 family protein n=1 Tax=Streptomyces coryli TaxID=1128680 RepID=A0A6G4U819_9ACTN|nr:TIGR03089 family protein [Streptomyces coryli]NGN68385.1 TIGR03089 family protein [Streptomyces coryli]
MTATPYSLLTSALAANPTHPLITYYDDTTGERVELSAVTTANWVAKTANLLQGELAAEPGDRAAILLPAHWQTAVWLLACSATGVVADVGGDPKSADLVIAGPDALGPGRACSGERIALGLRPLGARFPAPPEGYRDYAVEVPGQPDDFAPFSPVDPGSPALAVAGEELTGAEAAARAAADASELGLANGSRLLSARPWDSWPGLSAGLLAPLAAHGSVVLCPHLDRLEGAALEKRHTDERVTHVA